MFVQKITSLLGKEVNELAYGFTSFPLCFFFLLQTSVQLNIDAKQSMQILYNVEFMCTPIITSPATRRLPRYRKHEY